MAQEIYVVLKDEANTMLQLASRGLELDSPSDGAPACCSGEGGPRAAGPRAAGSRAACFGAAGPCVGCIPGGREWRMLLSRGPFSP